MGICKRNLLTVSVLAVIAFPAHAERAGYSYIGFGHEISDYEETVSGRTANGMSIDLETDYRHANVGQLSGTHIRFTPEWGAHLIQGATVTSNAEIEDWVINGETVQTNGMIVSNTYVKLLGDYTLTESGSLLFGASYQQIEYNRFDFRITDAGEAMNVGTEASAVTENGLSLNGIAGYQLGIYFDGSLSPWQYQMRLLAEVPFYHDVSNTSLNANDSFTESFNGYNLIASANLGYRLTQHVAVSLSMRASAHYRDSSSRTAADGTPQALPESTYYTLLPALSAYWSY